MKLRNGFTNFYSLKIDLNSKNDVWLVATTPGSTVLENSVILEKTFFFSVASFEKKGGQNSWFQ